MNQLNLTDEQKQRAEAASDRAVQAEAQGAITDDPRAGFKIQINFGPNRSALKEFGALLSFYSSGKHFHGGGDDLLYVCLDRLELERRRMNPKECWKFYLDVLRKKIDGHGCGKLISSAGMGGGVAYCANCAKGVISANLVNPLFFWGTVNELAGLAAEVFHRVTDSNADVYCKYDPTDIRYTTVAQTQGSEAAHKLRGLFIYPLKNILKDAAAGATVESRFRALFCA